MHTSFIWKRSNWKQHQANVCPTRVTKVIGLEGKLFLDYSLRLLLKDKTNTKYEWCCCNNHAGPPERLHATKTTCNTSPYSACGQQNTNLTAIAISWKKTLELPIPSLIETETLSRRYADQDFRVTSSTPPKSWRQISQTNLILPGLNT